MNDKDWNLLRWSLVFVWLFTATVSVWELHGQSAVLLAQAGIHSPRLADLLTLCGAGTDAVLGVLLWSMPTRWVVRAALLAMVGMTLAATVLLPSLWLHPLGPLSKNLPIAVALWILQRATK